MADRLLPRAVQDVDGVTDQRSRTVSLFKGPAPELGRSASENAEVQGVADWLQEALAGGTAPSEIGAFVRSRAELGRARLAILGTGAQPIELSEHEEATAGRVAVGTMHLAKGLEFKAVAVMACDDAVLPLRAWLEAVANDIELEVYETERHLLYVLHAGAGSPVCEPRQPGI